jgi:hypothetical protein
MHHHQSFGAFPPLTLDPVAWRCESVQCSLVAGCYSCYKPVQVLQGGLRDCFRAREGWRFRGRTFAPLGYRFEFGGMLCVHRCSGVLWKPDVVQR